MSANHPALLYLTQKGLEDEIIEFLKDGIERNERCVFLSTQNNTSKMYNRLCSVEPKLDVIKYFSYFNIPDPKKEPEKFTLKMNLLQESVLNEKFQGRVAFNVLDDISRFSIEDIVKIEEIEKYLHQISNEKLKIFCSFKIDKDGENNNQMIKMVMANHDHMMFEKMI